MDLTAEQVDACRRILGTLGERVQALMSPAGLAESATLGDDDRGDRFAEFRRGAQAAGAAAEEGLREVLNDSQEERLGQLLRQRNGAQALLEADAIEALGLSPEQREKIESLLQASFNGFGPPQIDSGTVEKAIAVLDDSQRAAWEKMLGKPFDFAAALSGATAGRQGPGGGFGGFPGFGGPGGPAGGPGGFRGPNAPTREILADFDANGDGWLNADERKATRESLAANGSQGGGFPFGGRGGRGPGGGRGPFGRSEPGRPGIPVAVADVPPLEGHDLYDPSVVRTLFLQFDSPDWEEELEVFHGTDVDVPATLIVDGKTYPNVGVRFRGMSSYMMLPRGSKRSLNVSLDLADEGQRLYGAKTLNLLNSHEDPTFLHTVLYSRIAREYIPAPQANFVRVVINGESWGLYVNSQQFDKIFAAENYGDGEGTRWKVSGSPGADGGLRYLGNDLAEYRRRYEIKGKDVAAAWAPLVELCRVLNETPIDELEAAIEPLLDVEGVLWFLALENALINSDGYWIRASDYCLYRDAGGTFHVVPHDMNEVFQPAMGPGMGGGRRGGGFGGPPGEFGGPGGFGPPGGFGGPGGGRGGGGSYDLDPLVGLDDASKPLRSRLLAVPAFRVRYLDHVREIAERWLDWDRLGPIVADYVALIDGEIQADTRKLSSYEEFLASVAPHEPEGGEARRSLYQFAQRRRAFLMRYEPPGDSP